MEDCCDTCTRIEEDLNSPYMSAADKELLNAYKYQHIADSTTMKMKKPTKKLPLDDAVRRTPSILSMFKPVSSQVNMKLGKVLVKEATKVMPDGALDRYLLKRGVEVPPDAYTTSEAVSSCAVENSLGDMIDANNRNMKECTVGDDTVYVGLKRRKAGRPFFSDCKSGRWTNTTVYGYAQQDLMVTEITLKQAQIEYIKMACSVVHTDEERWEAVRYLLTQEMSSREDILTAPSRFKAKNNANNKFDRDIGRALVTKKEVPANGRIGTDLQFRGLEVSQSEWSTLENKCYCVHLRKDVYLNC